jgi:ATP-dependent DNA helicase RecQ
MADFDIKQVTVLDHLFTYLQEGNTIRSDGLLGLSPLPHDRILKTLETMRKLGPGLLKPVFDALKGEVGYDDLKLFRLYCLSKYQPAMASPGNDHQIKPRRKKIVCLANSRKYSGRCVAGKELLSGHIGDWVRPVSSQETGELSLKEIGFPDGRLPALLDILSVPLAGPDPHSYQSENYLMDRGSWEKEGVLPVSDLPKLCDGVEHLWVNGHHSHTGLNDRIPLKTVEESVTSSLLLVKPDHLAVTVDEGARHLKKIRAKFIYNGVTYWLSVTDPLIEGRYMNEAFGQYPLTRTDAYICVSIGEPYEGYCYKLVAGIIGG